MCIQPWNGDHVPQFQREGKSVVSNSFDAHALIWLPIEPEPAPAPGVLANKATGASQHDVTGPAPPVPRAMNGSPDVSDASQ